MVGPTNRRWTVKIAAAIGLLLPLVAATAAGAASSSRGFQGISGCSPDWPSFQHDQSHTGSTCSQITPANVDTLSPAWFYRTSSAVTAEPAIVAGTAYVGDNGGLFYALPLSSGTPTWTFDVTRYDQHSVSNGVITSSAAYTDQVRGLPPMVVFGGGGSVFALEASNGRILWHSDLAPSDPTGPDEVESSPVVLPRLSGSGVVIVGLDTNESTQGLSGGVIALDAATGAPLWTFEPGAGAPVPGLPRGGGNGCNDVWSSPAVDADAPGGGLVFFGTGNCPDGHAVIDAISAATGRSVWNFVEPPANRGTDDDFGSSPIVTSLGRTPVVVEAGKSGWVYVLNEGTGASIDSAQVAEPGQTGDGLAGAIGGFIGSMALAPVKGHPAVFGNTAVPVPFTGNGATGGGSIDTSLAGNPTRMSSLHAYDIASGRVLWQQPLQMPSYAPVTETDGVLFAPSTTGFSLGAYDATTGLPLWAAPLAASASGGVAVSGPDIVFGAGTYEAPNAPVPPQLTGIWLFHLAAVQPVSN